MARFTQRDASSELGTVISPRTRAQQTRGTSHAVVFAAETNTSKRADVARDR